MIIIVDCMGGDNAPREVVRGAYLASLEYNASFVLVGDRTAIEQVAAEDGIDLRRFDIVYAASVIEMTDDPVSVVRSKSDSSMSTALRLLAEGRGDAVVSTGNTGALFTGATLIVRKIKGVRRAAIASILPMTPPVLLIDSGANVVVTDEYIEQFAVMGSIYMHKVYGLAAPRVGLLNNGAEECKGTDLQLRSYRRLSELPSINFVGNVEADQLPKNACDELVADGFTGNVLLKCVEGMGRLMLTTMKEIFYSDARAKLSGMLIKGKVADVKKRFDASEHGGAPLLGISKPVIKAHGSSNANAVKNAIRQAINYSNTGVIVNIAREIKSFGSAEAGSGAADAAATEGSHENAVGKQ